MTRKRVLGWIINTLELTIFLSSLRLNKFPGALVDFPYIQRRTYWRKWVRLVGILGSLFAHLHPVLTGGHIRLHLSATPRRPPPPL